MLAFNLNKLHSLKYELLQVETFKLFTFLNESGKPMNDTK